MPTDLIDALDLLFDLRGKRRRRCTSLTLPLWPNDIYTLQKLMGHERPETTAIYLQVVGQEAHDLQMSYWQQANKSWEK